MRVLPVPLAKAIAVLTCVLSAVLLLVACGGGGSNGAPGAPGAPGASQGTLAGTVTNSLTHLPLAGVTVTPTPAAPGVVPPVTGATGAYSMTLPVGSYVVTTSGPTSFGTVSSEASVLAALTTTLDLQVAPSSPVKVTVAGAPTSPAPGASFTMTGTAQVFDGSSILGWQWTQTDGAAATLATPTAASTGVTLADGPAYKAALLAGLEALERWRVMPVNPHAQGAGSTVGLDCKVTTTSGTYTVHTSVVAKPPFLSRSGGIQNVPVAVPVLLGGKTQATYDWTLETRPASSTATMQDATMRYPWFLPDVPGTYGVKVTDTVVVPASTVRFNVYAGKWYGAITGIDGAGLPVAGDCTALCHAPGGYFPEKFPAWAASGHAAVFKDNINAGGHYSSSCFECHTVGYNPSAVNDGIDDQGDYGTFLSTMWPGGHLTANAGNYAQVLATWPDVGRRTNIQCENCHGPNGEGSGHMLLGVRPDPRVSLAAEVCGACHGEPPRHGRYQQWEDSAHAKFETAISEGTSASCAKCHSANGFLDWLPDGVVNTVPTAETVQPITCVVCHDPHAVGTTTDKTTDAPLRVMGDTPVLDAGFAATNVGKGAMCMLCHNARRGLQNDQVGLSSAERAPHEGPQTDVLFGQNAFFVAVGQRAAHGFIGDTCVTCHVVMSPPPAEWSSSGGGTNHSFMADKAICTNCHGSFDGGTIEAQFDDSLGNVVTALSTALTNQMKALVAGGYTIELTTASGLVTVDGTNANTVAVTGIGSSHGNSAVDVTVGGVPYAAVRLHSDAAVKNAAGAKVGSLASNTVFTNVTTAYYSGNPTSAIGRAEWNYLLLHNDLSKSFHNPGFATNIFNNTVAVLNALTWTLAP